MIIFKKIKIFLLHTSYINPTNIKVLRKLFIAVLTLTSLVILAGCSKTSTSLTSRVYHDVTLRYNYYWNANFILEQTLKNSAKSTSEDYTKILALTKTGQVADPISITPDMDKVIKKSSIGVQLHPNSKWTDDAYLVMGKGYYMKGNYEEAVKTFQYITAEFEEGLRKKETAKKRKKRAAKQRKNKDENIYYEGLTSFLKHKPIRWEAMIWIIKSYTQLEKYNEAQSIISFAKGDKLFPEPFKDELELAITEFYIHQNEFGNAAQALQNAIANTDNKKQQIRYYFILGQLNEQNGNNVTAIENFNKVLELDPDFEMEFYAKMNVVKLSRKEKLSNTQEIIALLNTMLKNEKYNKFKGDIYYALAEIYQQEKQIGEAISNYKLAIENSTKNEQKALAYLQLADIHFDQEKYVISKAYYDSSLLNLDKEYPGFDQINERSNILKDLVQNISVISMQDSLQKLAKLTDSELQEYLESQREIKQNNENVPVNNDPLFRDESNVVLASNWPFDNPAQKGTGFTEFKRIWGSRPLEDNWRRSQRSVISNIDVDNTPIDDVAAVTNIDDLKKTLPVTNEQLLASNEKIIQSYYNIGTIYRDRLNSSTKASETFETLLSKYPQNKFRLESAYYLYLLFKDSDPTKAAKYKAIVLNEYPESTVAKVLKDPNYIESTEKAKNQVNDYYASTYKMFEQEQFSDVIKRSFLADSIFTENPLKPKFDMLLALSYGKMGKMDSFKNSLERIVNKYPMDEVKTRAVEILNLIEGSAYTSNNDIPLNQQYLDEPSTNHLVIVIFEKIDPNITTMQGELANYNDLYFKFDNLKISSLLLNNETQIVVVRDFPNAQKAMNYYNSMRYNEKVFKNFDKEQYKVFAISNRNYGVFFREKDVSEYMKFFSKNYLKQ